MKPWRACALTVCATKLICANSEKFDNLLAVSNQVVTNPCCGLAVIFCGFILLLIGRETINILKIFSGVHGFTGKTVMNIIIHWIHYFLSDWLKAYGEFLKSALETSSSCRLDNNHVRTLKVTGYHVMHDCSVWFLRVLLCQVHTLCVACLQWTSKNMNSTFFHSMYNKTILLDEVFGGRRAWCEKCSAHSLTK